MILDYLSSYGGVANRKRSSWDLYCADGLEHPKWVFGLSLGRGSCERCNCLASPWRGYVSMCLNEEGELSCPRTDISGMQCRQRNPRCRAMHDRSYSTPFSRRSFASVAREEERGIVSFALHRKATERVGLLEVRQFRLHHCDADGSEWQPELQSTRQIVPEVRTLLMLRIARGGAQ